MHKWKQILLKEIQIIISKRILKKQKYEKFDHTHTEPQYYFQSTYPRICEHQIIKIYFVIVNIQTSTDSSRRKTNAYVKNWTLICDRTFGNNIWINKNVPFNAFIS